ncbi:unnamed protein product [Caenorhabditis sp. 36 PRJEB53466]|nr:unnamed protein product [Caenorhabditis sp. 36 PRJEB53466]
MQMFNAVYLLFFVLVDGFKSPSAQENKRADPSQLQLTDDENARLQKTCGEEIVLASWELPPFLRNVRFVSPNEMARTAGIMLTNRHVLVHAKKILSRISCNETDTKRFRHQLDVFLRNGSFEVAKDMCYHEAHTCEFVKAHRMWVQHGCKRDGTARGAIIFELERENATSIRSPLCIPGEDDVKSMFGNDTVKLRVDGGNLPNTPGAHESRDYYFRAADYKICVNETLCTSNPSQSEGDFVIGKLRGRYNFLGFSPLAGSKGEPWTTMTVGLSSLRGHICNFSGVCYNSSALGTRPPFFTTIPTTTTTMTTTTTTAMTTTEEPPKPTRKLRLPFEYDENDYMDYEDKLLVTNGAAARILMISVLSILIKMFTNTSWFYSINNMTPMIVLSSRHVVVDGLDTGIFHGYYDDTVACSDEFRRNLRNILIF